MGTAGTGAGWHRTKLPFLTGPGQGGRRGGGREVRYRVLTETETAKPLISLASLWDGYRQAERRGQGRLSTGRVKRDGGGGGERKRGGKGEGELGDTGRVERKLPKKAVKLTESREVDAWLTERVEVGRREGSRTGQRMDGGGKTMPKCVS